MAATLSKSESRESASAARSAGPSGDGEAVQAVVRRVANTRANGEQGTGNRNSRSSPWAVPGSPFPVPFSTRNVLVTYSVDPPGRNAGFRRSSHFADYERCRRADPGGFHGPDDIGQRRVDR